MINQLYSNQLRLEQMGFTPEISLDGRVSLKIRKTPNIVVLKKSGIAVQNPEEALILFVKENNQNVFFRINSSSKKTDEEEKLIDIAKKSKKSLDLMKSFAKEMLELDPNHAQAKKLKAFLNLIDNVELHSILDQVDQPCFYFEFEQPFMHTREFADWASKLLKHKDETKVGKKILDAFGNEGISSNVFPALPIKGLLRGKDFKVYSRNKAYGGRKNGLARGGKMGTELFPVVRKSCKKINDFLNHFFEHPYKEDSEEKGFYTVNHQAGRQQIIISTLSPDPYFELSFGTEEYQMLAAKALDNYTGKKNNQIHGQGRILVIEQFGDESPCLRLDKLVTNDQAKQYANDWHKGMFHGTIRPDSWTKYSPDNQHGLTVLSFYEAMNSIWKSEKKKGRMHFFAMNSKSEKKKKKGPSCNRVKLADCYKLYVGDNAPLPNIVKKFVHSNALKMMMKESSLRSIRAKTHLTPEFSNYLYAVRNLIMSKSNAPMIENQMYDHPCFHLGRLFQIADWMQTQSYVFRNMDIPTIPIGTKLGAEAYAFPRKSLAHLCKRTDAIKKQCLAISRRLKKLNKDASKIEFPVNTFDKCLRSIDVNKIPQIASDMDKIYFASGFSYREPKANDN